ncbi:5-dehydro-4-deoxyglucarate dehydratase [Marinococcus luteus]|jgi:5-dehydro-4-deoxyglucarate dehydratase|uniref:Probable 5-dehydro-4-deoxyglucarate dehydratase n=1 Tax=Marinococcus luteus TaxID=1122204 RepID=A0A1H2QTU8_9BACI|nr:5-dehydro-4-deoxyglucarate dehydratase [Marinococcus luteus]SDW10617.1 5-dehydro-4-deoxyglucarate dehydratase [Marinococcus luteus]
MPADRTPPTGISGFPVTPYFESGAIDEQALQENIEFLLEEGLESIFIACGAGEITNLSTEEFDKAAQLAISKVNGRVPVYTGVGGNLLDAVEKAEISEKRGADGYLVLPPYLVESEQEGLYEYYKAIVTSTDLNAVLYQRANAVVNLNTLQRLTEFPQVVGLKDGVGDMELNVELTQEIGDRLGWLNGMPMAEVTMPAYLPLGYNCYSSAISNYIPHISRRFYDALLEQDQATVNDIYHNIILPINRVRRKRKGYAVSLIKAGMEIVGLPVRNTVRPPVVPVEKEHYEELRQILKTAHEKYPSSRKVSI